MSIKKKLGMGVATAALGLTLVGGGTWAAFNDTATINNHFAAGTLNLEVGKNHPSHTMNFDLTNMKPGDNVQRIFKLNNIGSLAIKEVLLNTTANNFVDGTLPSNKAGYLSQFVVDFAQVDGESTRWEPRNNVVASGQELTLADLVAGPSVYGSKINPAYIATDGSGRINLAPLTTSDVTKRGIPVNPTDSDAVFIQITFKDDPTKTASGEYVQNKYQGDGIDFFFNLEATQWDGVHVDTPNGNGAINNDVQGSADGDSMPNPVTEGTGTHSTIVND